ncbi:MAG: TetR/AcrR family transcriptional regulator [Ilumatobacteraceae bacterium]
MRLSAPARREQLIQTALAVFAEKGYHEASMNDIADAAGVTKPVLYQHFESKRELYLALLDECGRRLTDTLTAATTEAEDGRSQTEVGFRAYFRFVHDDFDAFRLLFGSGARRDEEFAATVRKVVDRSAEAIVPLIAADISDEHRRVLAHALTGIVEGVSRHVAGGGKQFDPDTVAKWVGELAWGGLRSVRRD